MSNGLERNPNPGIRSILLKILMGLVIVAFSLCAFSIFLHLMVELWYLPDENLAQICVGRTREDWNPAPFLRDGVWYAAPPAPFFQWKETPTADKAPLVCGIVPRLSDGPAFQMLVVSPYVGWYPPR